MYIPQVPQILPLQRLYPWYPGQMGVDGSDVQRGLRAYGRGITLYVDPSHNNATAAADGTDPENPCLTLGQAITNLVNFETAFSEDLDHSVIQVSGGLDESLSVLDYTAYPEYLTIQGVGPSPWGVVWENSNAADPIAVLGAVGWRITGFRFYVPEAATGVVIPCTQAPYGGNAIGIRTVIDNCYFDGSVYGGIRGIDLHGAPYNINIINNIFAFMTSAPGACIASTNTGYADAYRAYIANNWFHESLIGIDASLNVSVVAGNLFQAHGVTTMATVVDLRLGTRGENLVSGNVFESADYSQAAGTAYWANAANPGMWAGNVSGDTAEAEVGDNGWTIAPPAP